MEAKTFRVETFFEHSLFIFFLLSLPFSIRKIFLFFPTTSAGLFNEYTDISLYLSDILLGLFFAVLILNNKNTLLSISWWRRMFHVEHLVPFSILPLLFILWSLTSIFWSENRILALYSGLKLIESYVLFLCILLYNVPRGTNTTKNTTKKMFHVEHSEGMNQIVPRGTFSSFLKRAWKYCSTWNNIIVLQKIGQMFHVEQLDRAGQNVPRGTISRLINKCSTRNNWHIVFITIIISGLFQSFIAILQFLQQGSLGLTFLRESVFSTSDTGIAKILLENNTFIRAYGLFPHPNVLAGFLGISLLFTLAYPLVFHKMFHVEHIDTLEIVPRGTFLHNFWSFRLFHVEHMAINLYRIALSLQIFAFLFTFSKTAWAGLAISLIYFWYFARKLFHVEQLDRAGQNVPRGTFAILISKCSTWNISKISDIKKMFHVEHLLWITAIIAIFVYFKAINSYYFLVQPLKERLFFDRALPAIGEESFFDGIGIGQFVFSMQHFFDEKLSAWQFQPIHNVFLLIFAETGFVGILLFILFWVSLIVSRGTISRLIHRCSTWNIVLYLKRMFHVEHSTYHISEPDQNVPRGTLLLRRILQSALIFFTFILLFDHYLWDIQQGQLLLWLIVGLAVSSRLTTHRIDNTI